MSKTRKPDACYRIRCEAAGDETYYLDVVCESVNSAEFWAQKHRDRCWANHRKPPKMTIVKFVEETN